MSFQLLLAGRNNYIGKVLSIGGANLIGYWPLWEASGTTAEDRSGNDHDGEYTGVTLAAEPGIGDGRRAPFFDGANDYVDIYSAGFASAFDSSEGSLIAWFKVDSASVWTDGVARRIAQLRTDGSNRIILSRAGSDNSVDAIYIAGGSNDSVRITVSDTEWVPFGITWSVSADEVKAYINGDQSGSTQTGLGTWSGSLGSSNTIIGADTQTPSFVWDGLIAHVQVYDVALTPTQISNLSRV